MIEHNFKKRFGQNFLSDKNLLDAIVRDAEVSLCDEVLEIGAGAGALTMALAKQVKKVVSYEIDRDLLPSLKALCLPNVSFILGDALKIDIKEIENHFQGEYSLVANLPYYITSPLIFKFLEQATRLKSMTIMVQKEVAQRICSKCGDKDYGLLSVMVAFYGEANTTRIVSRKMFNPMPKVDSAVVNIKIDHKFPKLNSEAFTKFVKACFAMRRKTLQNNLQTAGYSKVLLESRLNLLDLKARADSLSLQELVEIFEKVNG